MANKISGYIITGVSGSGKSTVLKALEDIGFYCADNIPTILLPQFFEIFETYSKSIKNVAVGVDIRENFFLDKFPEIYSEFLKNRKNMDIKIIYLDANDEEIIKRFKETRRLHPLKTEDFREGLKIERKKLSFIKDNADIFIDTSFFNVHRLKKFVYNNLSFENPDMFKVNIVSFGFKNGILSEADLVFDVRFLKNPYFIPELKSKTGNEPEITDYVLSDHRTTKFLEHLYKLLSFLLPEFRKEGKSFSVIGIGCTGGMHRSVVIANKIAEILDKDYNCIVRHRDI